MTFNPFSAIKHGRFTHFGGLSTTVIVTLVLNCPAAGREIDKSVSETPSEAKAPVEFRNDAPASDAWKRFSELSIWEDGLSEMCYYDATCNLLDKPRKYTRVHMMNRQYMDTTFFIKASKHTKAPRPAFQFIISEEIPTDNYNYRFLITAFMERPSLRPIKVAVSSQEWCGTTVKYLTWERHKEVPPKNWSLDVCCYSYLPTEGDRWFPHADKAYIDAYESLFVYARAVVASGGEARPMKLLKCMHTNHMPDPEPLDATLRVEGQARKIKVPLGKFTAQRVVLDWKDAPTWFDVETAPPYRLLAFRADNVEAKLRFVERRAYWDHNAPSGFYKKGQAP
ncbi:MAG: hypothetical protein V3W34_17810 [Phycisphaerae bacterium]